MGRNKYEIAGSSRGERPRMCSFIFIFIFIIYVWYEGVGFMTFPPLRSSFESHKIPLVINPRRRASS